MKIEQGTMAFVQEGREGVGAVLSATDAALVIYVENAGEFTVPRSAVRAVHDKKVILDISRLDRAFLSAIGHAHDREDGAARG